MKFKDLLRALTATVHPANARGVDLGVARTTDSAIQFRMIAGFPGDVNRTHPASIEPALQNTTHPVLGFGLAVVADGATNSVRQVQAGDTALTGVYGFSVRPFPIQQGTTSNPYGGIGFGSGAPPTNQPIDVLRAGYIITTYGGAGTPGKGDPVYVWIAAGSGAHVQGAVESQSGGSSTIPLTAAGSVATFNGPPDAQGNVEIEFNV